MVGQDSRSHADDQQKDFFATFMYGIKIYCLVTGFKLLAKHAHAQRHVILAYIVISKLQEQHQALALSVQ